MHILNNSKTALGIIGYGSFGRFAVDKLSDRFTVKVYDATQDVSKDLNADLNEIGSCDYIMLAVPVDAYETVLTDITPHSKEQAVIIDIGSVKEESIRQVMSVLPQQPFIATHPLFGPESAQESLLGHTLVLCETRNVEEGIMRSFKNFCVQLGLNIVEMSATEHDKEMAVVQGLTFFVSRALHRSGIHGMKLQTPSFKKLLDLARLDEKHSDELLATIFLENTYARTIRDTFVKDIDSLNDEIDAG